METVSQSRQLSLRLTSDVPRVRHSVTLSRSCSRIRYIGSSIIVFDSSYLVWDQRKRSFCAPGASRPRPLPVVQHRLDPHLRVAQHAEVYNQTPQEKQVCTTSK